MYDHSESNPMVDPTRAMNAEAALESEQRRENLKRVLDDVVLDTGAITVLLITREGVCLCEAGMTGMLNSTAMAALVAGMFSATREVANIVGEKQFSILLQQGEKRHIHISLIGRRTMLVVVFEDYTRIGKVRLGVRKASPDIANLLERRQHRPGEDPEELSLPKFKEFALNLVDRIFQVDPEEDAPH